MRQLDPAEVGLEQALENLNARLGARRQSAAKGSSAATASTASSHALVVSGSYGEIAVRNASAHTTQAI